MALINLTIEKVIIQNDDAEFKKITLKFDTMAKTLDEVLQSVRDNKTVGESAITLLNGLKTKLDEALSGTNLPPAVQAKIDEIFSTSEADKQALQDAITANTPSETPPGI